MKRIFWSLVTLIVVLVTTVSANCQNFAPKFAYDKFKAHLRSEAQKVDPDSYKAFYFIAPYESLNIPVMGLLIYDLQNNKMTLQEHGLKYNDNGDMIYFIHEIPMAYTSPTFVEVQGNEYYIVQDMLDGRGQVARRKYSFGQDAIDRGPMSDHANLLRSGRVLPCYKANELDGLEDAFSRFR